MSINQLDNQLDTCDICLETYNSTTNKKITCYNPNCRKSLCLKCCKNMFKSFNLWEFEHSGFYHCPYCKIKWNWDFLSNNFSINFINNTLINKYEEVKKDFEFLLCQDNNNEINDEEIDNLPPSNNIKRCPNCKLLIYHVCPFFDNVVICRRCCTHFYWSNLQVIRYDEQVNNFLMAYLNQNKNTN